MEKPTVDLGDPNDPIAKQIRKDLEKLNGKEVAKRFTVHGEVIVVQVDGKQVDMPLEADELDPLPTKFSVPHRDVMEIIYSAVSQIAEKPNRIVPLTRNELVKEFGASPKIVKELERFGLIRTRVIKLVPKDQPQSTKGQATAIVYFTPQGRAYVRDQFDPSYGSTVDGGSPAGEPVGGNGIGGAAGPDGGVQPGA